MDSGCLFEFFLPFPPSSSFPFNVSNVSMVHGVHGDFEPKADEGMRRVASRLRAQLARVRSGQVAPAPTSTEDRGSCSSVGRNRNLFWVHKEFMNMSS